MAKHKRIVFHSSLMQDRMGGPRRRRDRLAPQQTRKASEAAAIAAGRKANQDGGLGQAVLHKSDGTIREERTYGKDPERRPG